MRQIRFALLLSSSSDEIEISNMIINAGGGKDTIYGNDERAIIYLYDADNGDDVIYNFSASDSLNVSNSTYTTVENNNDVIVNVGNSSITLKDAKNVVINITTDSTLSEKVQETSLEKSEEGIYAYKGGNRTIKDYSQGAQINLASDFTGIGLDDNNFYINSSSGNLKIENARDKIISYGDANGNLVAYSYMANSGGDIDGREISQFEVIIVGNHANNQIFAGSGGSSLWGGNGGNDTLVGGDGYDEFFFAMGSGGDVIQNAGDNDIVNLLGVTLDQISTIYVSMEQVHINFTNGEFLKVKGDTGVGYRLENQIYICNQSTGEWSTK